MFTLPNLFRMFALMAIAAVLYTGFNPTTMSFAKKANPAMTTQTPEAGFTQLPGGLQYKDEPVGTGAVAQAGQLVSVHYTGTLLDGTKFDSSKDRGQPFQFPLGAGQVIKGWDEGVAGMKVGGTRTLIIPSAMAYGDRGTGPIPPGATLKFVVELLAVN
jgi:FKBP-type peptidyl-prolyl cis-trans isomerase